MHYERTKHVKRLVTLAYNGSYSFNPHYHQKTIIQWMWTNHLQFSVIETVHFIGLNGRYSEQLNHEQVMLGGTHYIVDKIQTIALRNQQTN